MEKNVTWFLILLKNQCKNIRTWLLLFLMLFVFVLYQQMAISADHQRTVGVVCRDSKYGQVIYERLENMPSEFVFQKMTDEDEMIRQVKNHTLECGFVFDSAFDQAFQMDYLTKTVDWYVSEQQVYANVARESMSVAMNQVYAEQVLTDHQEYIFGTKDEKQLERLLDYNRQYLQGDELFAIQEQKWMNSESLKQEKTSDGRKNGMGRLILFLGFLIVNLLLAMVELHQPQKYGFYFFLRDGQRVRFLFIHMLTASMPVLVVGLLQFMIF